MPSVKTAFPLQINFGYLVELKGPTPTQFLMPVALLFGAFSQCATNVPREQNQYVLYAKAYARSHLI